MISGVPINFVERIPYTNESFKMAIFMVSTITVGVININTNVNRCGANINKRNLNSNKLMVEVKMNIHYRMYFKIVKTKYVIL